MVHCIEPKITSHGDVIYPLQVLLDTLPAMTRRIRLSVNVWTPELNAFHQSDVCKEGDFLGYFVDHDPNDQIEELKSAFRCHVNATLPVVTPPTMRCKYLQVAGKHFLCVEVINILGEAVNLHQVNICVSSDVAVANSGIQPSGAKFHLKQHSKPRSSFLNVLPIPTCEKETDKSPVFLRPWEHHAYLFRVIYREHELTLRKHVAVTLKGLITWDVKTLMKRDLKINTAYSLPVFNVRRSSVSVKATCQSSVIRGKRFQVKYTVTNTERDDGNVLLVWSPFSGSSTHTNYGTGLTEQSLICLQPQVRIGSCLPGSSHAVNVEFLAVQEGLHEVGKFMKCMWYSESDETFFPGSPFGSQSNLQFTTVSHSCQVFVKNMSESEQNDPVLQCK